MQPSFNFLVSQPSSCKTKPSGFRAFECKNDRIYPLKVDTVDRNADTNSIVQKICYLRPRVRPIDISIGNTYGEECSDYLLVAKNNGIIEIIKDYDFKIRNRIPLRPNYLLVCVPINTNIVTNDTTIVGMEYSDKFLYVCSSNGDLFGFILNLPDDYVSEQDFQAPEAYKRYKDTIMWRSDSTPPEDTTPAERFLREGTQFKNAHTCAHICYYCYPVNEDGFFHETIRQWYPKPIPAFSNCFITFLRTDVSSFHINPMDRFSVITVAPHTPLTIHKILLPEFYVVFFHEFVKLKDEYFSKKLRQNSEPPSFDFMSRVVYDVGFQDYLKRNCSQYASDHDIRLWRSMLVCDMVCEFKYSSVWRQKQGNMKDSLHRLFFYDASLNDGKNVQNDIENLSDSVVDLELDSQSNSMLGFANASIDVDHHAHSNITHTERFLKHLRKRTFPINFQVVKTVSVNTETETNELEATTSFLTDTYKDMDIILVEKFLNINAFRPKYVDEPLMKLDSIHDVQEINEKEYEAQVALNNLSSFVKFFMLSDSLCMIWDSNGVLLIDRFQLRNTTRLLENDVNAVKVIDYRVGVVNDIGLVLTEFEHTGSDYHIEFYAILSMLTNEIVLLKGEFNTGQRLGKIAALDKLRVTERDRFVDQIMVTNYHPTKKRTLDSFSAEILRKQKRQKHENTDILT